MIEAREISLAQWAAGRAANEECAAYVTLDSAAVASDWSRWSYLPGPVSLVLSCDATTHLVTLHNAAGEIRRWTDPLEALAWLGAQCKRPVVAGPPFKGGWIGYFGYDVGRLFEVLPARAVDDLGLPLFRFTFHNRVMVLDQQDQRAYSCSLTGVGTSLEPMRIQPRFHISNKPVVSNFTREAYTQAVERAIEYIRAGDIFQVNLSQRFVAGLPQSAGRLYRALQRKAPAWFGASLIYDDLRCSPIRLSCSCASRRRAREGGRLSPGRLKARVFVRRGWLLNCGTRSRIRPS